MYLQLFSPCDHLRCPLRTYLSQTVHHAFTKRSPCAHRSFSVQLLFSQIGWFLDWQQYIQVVYANLFLITDETQCKEAHLSVVHLAFPQRSHIVYCAFTVHFVCAFALCVPSSFTVYMSPPNSVQHALTVHLECVHCSLTVQVGK